MTPRTAGDYRNTQLIKDDNSPTSLIMNTPIDTNSSGDSAYYIKADPKSNIADLKF